MDITKIDSNFKIPSIPQDVDIQWHDLSEKEFSVYGVNYDKSLDCYVRMPKEIADEVSAGVSYLNTLTSGGRIRFMSDSPYIGIQQVGTMVRPMRHMTVCGSHCFSVYMNGRFIKSLAPDVYPDVIFNCVEAEAPSFLFEQHTGINDNSMKLFELYFPLYGGVRSVKIGLKSNAKILPAPAYKIKTPVVFYGNSITQGGCACQSGNSYPAQLSRRLDFDFINLGFSGNGKAEPIMCEYLSSLEASAFVIDYDHNAPDAEYLRNTHYPLYETIRKKHKTTPILFLTKPDWFFTPDDAERRKEIIYATYKKAKKNGDNNVWFVDGKELFGNEHIDACTVDGCHPNDLGFFRITERIEPVLKEMLAK